MDVLTALAGLPVIGPYLPYFILSGAIAGMIATALPAPPPSAGPWYVFLYRFVNVTAFNFGHAANAGDAKPKLPPPVSPPLAGLVLLLLVSLLMVACGADGNPSPRAAAAIRTGCTLDRVLQPAAAAMVPALVPGAAGVVALDSAAIHPAVMSACDELGRAVPPVPPAIAPAAP